MTTRIACRTPGCPGEILPETAQRTGGLCMPCVKRPGVAEALRAWEVESVRGAEEYRIAATQQGPATDVVDLLWTWHAPPQLGTPRPIYARHEGPIAAVYASLSQADFDRWIDLAVREGLVVEIAPFVAAFCEVDRDKLHHALLGANEPWPPEAFRGASVEIAQRLAALVESACAEGNRGLAWQAAAALAWTRTDTATERFRRWRKAPPEGWPDEHGPIDQAARAAGYEPTDEGLRELTLERSFVLRFDVTQGEGPRVRVLEPITKGPPCPHCGRLGRFVLACAPHELPPGLQDLPALVPTCLACVFDGFGTLFTRVGESGEWTFLPSTRTITNGHVSRDDCFGETGLTAMLEERPAHASLVGPDGGEPLSQLGGHPWWVQGEAHLACPCCQLTMMAVAVIAPGDWDAFDEVIYVHHSKPCGVVGVGAQR